MATKTVVILGGTGSIGTQTVDVLRKLEEFKLIGFTYHRSREQALSVKAEFPEAAMISTEKGFQELENFLRDSRPDIVVSAIPGFAGFLATLISVKYTKRLALANKESMVCGGRFLREEVERYGVELVPVDSEHSAVFQVMEEGVEKIAITASGGALRDWAVEDLEKARPEDVLSHPVWRMGSRITVDSATMVNKALEVLEAMELFSLRRDQIEVFIHRQGVVHGMVYLKDGTVKLHAAVADMRLPIAFALTYPERKYEFEVFPKFDVLTFENPDKERYPLFFMVDEIFSSYKLRVAFNAADEVAVSAFLKREIRFTDIAVVVERVLRNLEGPEPESVKDLIKVDEEARRIAWREIEKL